ncbi:MAG: response regulator [Euryarchaeota archaeon]|nr:response regulator [Euryarchaeota archaeon]
MIRAPGTATTSGPALHGTLEPRPYRVLVVDDDLDLRAFLGQALTFQSPFDCSAATEESPARAFEELSRGHVDIVLSDWQMPEEDGVSFLTRVKEAHPSVLRLLITAHRDLKALLGAVTEAEVDGYLEKPINAQLARDMLYDALLRRQLRTRSGGAETSPKERPSTTEAVLKGLRARTSPGEPRKTLGRVKRPLASHDSS